MKFLTFVVAAILAAATVVSGAPSARPRVKIGKRDLILPATCHGKNGNGDTVDFMDTLKKGLAEVDEMISASTTLPPDQFDNWFSKWLNIIDHTFWEQLATASGMFNLPTDQFGTIIFDCETQPNACLTMKELDGSPRLAVTDWVNDIIYACPALWSTQDNTKLIHSVANPDSSDGTDLLCPDTEVSLADRHGLQDYYMFATTLIREISHTGSAIRRTGHEFRFDDLKLHAKVERFGWMATHGYFQRRCGYEIPIAKDDPFDDAISEGPTYQNPVTGDASGIPV